MPENPLSILKQKIPKIEEAAAKRPGTAIKAVDE
jgi:hypothetical protein